MSLPENGYTQPVEIVVGGTLPRNGWVQPVEIVAGGAMAIGGLVIGGTPGSILFVDVAGNLGQNNPAFFWDNTNFKETITGSGGGPQFRLAYDATRYVDFQITPWIAGAGTLFSIIPKTQALPNAFCQWIMQGSDFCMSYEGDSVNGQGVPNLTIRGPASAGYAASSGPGFNLYNNLSVVDGKLWAMYLNDQVLTFQLINDANNSTNNWMTVTRNALALTNITLGTHLYSGSDGNLDLGQTANRWKGIYFAGQAIGPQGALATPTYSFTGATTYGLYFASGIGPALQYNSSLRAAANSSGWGIYNAGTLQFSGGTGAPDTFIARDGAANIIAVVNGANAQTFRVYGTTTGPVYGQIKHDGTNLLITQNGGNQIAFATGALATSATTGFPCANSSAGAPTGTPTNIPTGTVPWEYDTTNDQVNFYNSSWKAIQAGTGSVSCKFKATANVALNNSAAETSMYGTGIGSQTLPANFLAAGTTVKGVVKGFFTTGVAPQTLTVKIKLGTNIVASVTFAPITSATNLGFEVEYIITCRTTGAGGTVIGQARIIMDSTTLTASLVDFAVATGTVAVDTTATQKADVTFTTAIADAGSTYTSTNAVVEACT